jgi:hypothetical protein
MTKAIPPWAMRRARPEDQDVVRISHRQGTLHITWPDLKALRGWAKQHEWPTPWVGFEEAFITRMLDNQATFDLAITDSGIELHIPKQDYTISGDKLRELDALYEDRSPSGRPTGWGILVEALREVRRAVEAGVVVRVEETQTIRTWQEYYNWAHGRYHMLEDGSDHWIGDDTS